MEKKVSVIIPTYNRPKELIKSIQTVLNQTYPGEIEIIIIDDSKKSQQKVIEEKLKIQKRKKIILKYIHNAKKKGSPYARNIGLKKSTGEYIAFLDDDDEWLPEKIEKQVKIMDKYNDVGLVVCYSLDKRFGRERISKPPENITHEIILKAFNLSSSSAYLLRKSTIKKTGEFDILLPSAQEYDLAIRLSKYYKVYCVQEVLMIQNSTEGQISENWKRKIKGMMILSKKYYDEYKIFNIKDRLFHYIKMIGIIAVYFLGYIIGNKIYGIITLAKGNYEVG